MATSHNVTASEPPVPAGGPRTARTAWPWRLRGRWHIYTAYKHSYTQPQAGTFFTYGIGSDVSLGSSHGRDVPPVRVSRFMRNSLWPATDPARALAAAKRLSRRSRHHRTWSRASPERFL